MENRPPARVRERLRGNPEQVANFNFGPTHVRVLFSLREDCLANLEAYSELMPSIWCNRMRLTRMNGQQALDAVMRPGAGLVSREVGEQIVRFVTAAGQRQIRADMVRSQGHSSRKLEVEPALLSLFCRELNNQRIAQGLPQITADLVETSSAQILQHYYEGCFAGQAGGARIFVEENLLTRDDHRDDIELQRAIEMLEELGAAAECLDELIKHRLLHYTQRGETRRVELTHDVLIPVVRDSRNKRHAREKAEKAEAREREAKAMLLRERAEARKKLAKQRRRLMWMAVVTAIVFGVAVYAWVEKDRAKRAQKAERQAKRNAEWAQNGEREAKLRAQSLKAAWRGVNMAPEKLEVALLLSADHKADISGVVFGNDGKTMFSADEDGVIFRWGLDVNSWQTLATSIAGRGFTQEEARGYLSEASPPSLSDAPTLLKRADVAALEKAPDARALFGEATKAALTSKDPDVSNQVCWFGSLDRLADVVLQAGDRAVDLADKDLQGYYRDTRGLARALAGKKQQAIEDYRAFIAWAEGHKLYNDAVNKRKEWIKEMEDNKDPFTDQTFRELRGESFNPD